MTIADTFAAFFPFAPFDFAFAAGAGVGALVATGAFGVFLFATTVGLETTGSPKRSARARRFAISSSSSTGGCFDCGFPVEDLEDGLATAAEADGATFEETGLALFAGT